MKRIILLALLLGLVLFGCEKNKETPQATDDKSSVQPVALKLPAPKKIFEEGMPADRFELPSEALQSWRHVQKKKPALVLFSIHPFLERIAEERRGSVADLVRTGDKQSFREHGSYYRTRPVLLPTQAVSAAIDNELFSELIWIIPTRNSIEELSLDVFRQQLVDAGFLTEEEGEKLTYSEGVTSGTVRGVPFRAVHPDVLPDLADPVVIHVDTGYFKGLFKNEVATPLYDILHRTVMRIMQSEWKVYAATLSYSTEELMFSLDVRFLVTALARMIEDPTTVQKMPKAWKLHADAMYMGNMYMESKSRELIEEAAVMAPGDPVIVYALSQVRFQQGRSDEAFTLLDKAVELDPGYGAAYIRLAEKGIENGQLDKALDLQRKAVGLYPENPFLQINEADLLIRLGRSDEAIGVINTLQSLDWSEYFHPNAEQNLEEMVSYARNPEPPTREASEQGQ